MIFIFAHSLNGGEGGSVNKPSQILDTIKISFLPIDKDQNKLVHLRKQKKLSISKIAKKTNHSYSFIKKVLKENDLYTPRNGFGIAPFGWELKNKRLIPNVNEQLILKQIKKLYAQGYRKNKIAHVLNKLGFCTKYGKTWWPNSVQKIINREILKKRNRRNKMRPP